MILIFYAYAKMPNIRARHILQILTGYEGNIWFVGPEDTNVAQGRNLKVRQQLFCY